MVQVLGLVITNHPNPNPLNLNHVRRLTAFLEVVPVPFLVRLEDYVTMHFAALAAVYNINCVHVSNTTLSLLCGVVLQNVHSFV